MLKSKIISIIIVFILTQTLFSEQSAFNTDDMIDIIITAQEAELATLKQGFGSCNMTSISETDTTDTITEKVNVKFYFKGLATRTDIGISDDLDQNSYSEVDTGEFWYRYNKLYDAALIEKSRATENHGREFSRDFHPNVYYGYLGGITLPELLDKVRDRCDIQFHYTNKGLLEFTSKYGYDADGNAAPSATTSMYYILLDPTHSYRPLKWTYEQKNSVFQGEYHKVECAIEWNDLSDYSYPASVTYFQTTIRSPERIEKMSTDGRHPPKSNTREVHIGDININPNTRISDEVFTLEGMGVKAGTLIDDMITGISYRYGASQVVDEIFLEDMLDNTSLPSDASENEKSLAYISDANTLKVTNQINQPGDILNQVEQSGSSTFLSQLLKILKISLCLFVAILFVLLFRFSVMRKIS